MKYSLLIQCGDLENLRTCLAPLAGDPDLEILGLSYNGHPAQVKLPGRFPLIGMVQEQPWNPAREWNKLRKIADDSLPVVLMSDDALPALGRLSRLAALAQESGGAIHASIAGNVINKPILRTPYREPVGEVVEIKRGTDLPLICTALPSRWEIEFDEGYWGYGREDHDFWEASLRRGKRVFVTRSVIVYHDDPMYGTGRTVGRRPQSGWAHNRERVQANEKRFFDKWGYY